MVRSGCRFKASHQRRQLTLLPNNDVDVQEGREGAREGHWKEEEGECEGGSVRGECERGSVRGDYTIPCEGTCR